MITKEVMQQNGEMHNYCQFEMRMRVQAYKD